MNILPKSSKEFARKEYWDQFFTRREKSFEWYGEYSELKQILLKYIKVQDRVLIVGCGNSTLSADLYDDGYRHNTSIDISEVVIKKMASKFKCNDMRPEMSFEVMDIFNMTFPDEQFNVILDKGTLDALSSDNLDLTKMFNEIDRVLTGLGRYICISLLQENVLRALIDRFSKNGSWIIRIHRHISAQKSDSDSVKLPVFIVVCTKLKAPLNASSAMLLDIDIQGNNHFYKCQNVNELFTIVDTAQKLEYIKFNVRCNKIEDENFNIELFGAQDSTESRYQLYFVQKATVSRTRCALFIVPQGREHEWLFSTNKGRENLLKQCQVDRLIVVHLSRNHHYESMDHIKDELSPQVSDFFPSDVGKINFLSIGDDLGERTLLYKDKSDFSGEFIVEDVKIDQSKYRRLIFMSNRNVIQSEAKLKSVKSKKKKKLIEVIDHEFLACDHHGIIAASLALIEHAKSDRLSLLIVGLGGGCFVNFLTHNLSPDLKIDITVVEIDKVMVDVAQKWFDYQANTSSSSNISTEIIIEDGIKYLEGQLETHKPFDFIIFDVDSKNLDLGLSCPPKEFVEETFLHKISSLLTPKGIFLLNLVARNEDSKKQIYQRLRSLFSTCLLQPVEDDLNEIICCTNYELFTWLTLKGAQQRERHLHTSPLYMNILEETYRDFCQKEPCAL